MDSGTPHIKVLFKVDSRYFETLVDRSDRVSQSKTCIHWFFVKRPKYVWWIWENGGRECPMNGALWSGRRVKLGLHLQHSGRKERGVWGRQKWTFMSIFVFQVFVMATSHHARIFLSPLNLVICILHVPMLHTP